MGKAVFKTLKTGVLLCQIHPLIFNRRSTYTALGLAFAVVSTFFTVGVGTLYGSKAFNVVGCEADDPTDKFWARANLTGRLTGTMLKGVMHKTSEIQLPITAHQIYKADPGVIDAIYGISDLYNSGKKLCLVDDKPNISMAQAQQILTAGSVVRIAFEKNDPKKPSKSVAERDDSVGVSGDVQEIRQESPAKHSEHVPEI